MYQWDPQNDSVASGLTKQQEQAFYFLNKALQIDPKNVEALIAKGSLLANLGRYEKSLEELLKALIYNPNHVKAKKETGETLVELGKQLLNNQLYEKASGKFELALQYDPDNDSAKKYFCETLVELSKLKLTEESRMKQHNHNRYLQDYSNDRSAAMVDSKKRRNKTYSKAPGSLNEEYYLTELQDLLNMEANIQKKKDNPDWLNTFSSGYKINSSRTKEDFLADFVATEEELQQKRRKIISSIPTSLNLRSLNIDFTSSELKELLSKQADWLQRKKLKTVTKKDSNNDIRTVINHRKGRWNQLQPSSHKQYEQYNVPPSQLNGLTTCGTSHNFKSFENISNMAQPTLNTLSSTSSVLPNFSVPPPNFYMPVPPADPVQYGYPAVSNVLIEPSRVQYMEPVSLPINEHSYTEKVNTFLKKIEERSSTESLKYGRFQTRTRKESRSRDSNRRNHSHYKRSRRSSSASDDSVICITSNSDEEDCKVHKLKKESKDWAVLQHNRSTVHEGLICFIGDSMARDAKPIEPQILEQYEVRDHYQSDATLHDLKNMLSFEVIPRLMEERRDRKILIVLFIGHNDIINLDKDGVTLVVKPPGQTVNKITSSIRDINRTLRSLIKERPNIKVIWTLPMIPDIKRYYKSLSNGYEPSLISRPPIYHTDDDALLLEQISLYAKTTNQVEAEWPIGQEKDDSEPINLSLIQPEMKLLYNELVSETYEMPIRFPRVNYRYDGIHFTHLARQEIWELVLSKWSQLSREINDDLYLIRIVKPDGQPSFIFGKG